MCFRVRFPVFAVRLGVEVEEECEKRGSQATIEVCEESGLFTVLGYNQSREVAGSKNELDL